MKQLLLAASVLAFSLGSAAAEDAIYEWSGAYIGVQGGRVFGHTSPSLTIPNGSRIGASAAGLAGLIGNTGSKTNVDSFGAQAGYNWQRGIYVVGVEGDVNHIDLTGTNIVAGQDINSYKGRAVDEIDANFFASVRTRVGITRSNLLFYGTAGIAFTDAGFARAVEWSYNDACPFGSTGMRKCHVGGGSFGVGYTVGGGAEAALSNHVSIKAEYLYANFGRAKFTTTSPYLPDQYLDHSAKLDLHTIRMGLNYKF